MANNRSNRSNAGGIGRTARRLLLFTLILVLVIPGISHAEEITGAVTKDANSDGHIDQIVVTFDAAPAQWAASDFQVDAAYRPVVDVTQNGATFTVFLTPRSEFDTGATPTVSFKGTDENTTDGAGPVLIGATGDDHGGASMFNYGTATAGDTLNLQFSEDVSLFLTTISPTGTPQSVPVAENDAVNRVRALEQAIAMGGPSGCAQDGDGTVTVNNGTVINKRNFPALSASQQNNINQNTSPEDIAAMDPVEQIAGAVVTIKQKPGNDGSGATAYKFNVTPESLPANQHCTAGIASDTDTTKFRFNVQDAAGNASLPKGGGPALINHVKGQLAAVPETVDANANGKIDGVAVTFNHPAKFDSINRALQLANRISIITGSGAGAVSATNLRCDSCNANPAGSAALVTVSFDEIAEWHTGVTPSVNYDGGGDCAATGIQVLLVNGLTECAGTFAQNSIDKARPVAIQAKTRDLGDAANPGANGKNDAVEVTFSEPVKDETFEENLSTWGVTGYSPNDFDTGAAADDTSVYLRFTEVAIDTDKTANLTYTQPGGATAIVVTDVPGNALANISAPGTAVLDGAGPALVSGSVLDAVGNADGRIDTAKFTFSEAVIDAPIVAAKFRIGKDADEVSANTTSWDGTADAKLVTATITAGIPGTNAMDLSVQAGAAFDAVGNPAPAARLAAADVQDLAKPVVIDVTPRGQNGASVPVTVTYSEAMDATVAPAVTYGLSEPFNDVTIAAVPDEEGVHKNGYRVAEPTKWDGTAPVPEGGSEACTDPTGCENQISVANSKAAAGDVSALTMAYAPDTRYTWTVDTVAPAFPPAFSSPANGAAIATNGTTANVVVSGTSTEPNLTIQVYEGDTLRGTATSTSTGNWSATLQTLGLGAHALKLRAFDAGGNASGFSAIRTIYVKQNTSLTIARNSSTAVYSYPITLSGTLRNAGGGALTNRLVTLQYLPYGTSSWRKLASIRTNSSGNYAYAYREATSNYYRAIYGGEATFMNSTSPTTFVPLRVLVTSAQSATSIRYGSYVTFTGGVRPAHPGKRVYLQVLVGPNRWSTITYAYLDRYSNYRFVYRPTARGTRYYRIYYPKQDTDHWDYWSATRRVAVS